MKSIERDERNQMEHQVEAHLGWNDGERVAEARAVFVLTGRRARVKGKEMAHAARSRMARGCIIVVREWVAACSMPGGWPESRGHCCRDRRSDGGRRKLLGHHVLP